MIFGSSLDGLYLTTYFGDEGMERATAIIADGNGHVYIGGWSESPALLSRYDGFDTTHSNNETDAFILKMSTRTGDIVSATWLGGDLPRMGTLQQGEDVLTATTLSRDGKKLYVTGRTESDDFFTTPRSLKNKRGMQLNTYLYRGNIIDRSLSNDVGDGFVTSFDPSLLTCRGSVLFGGSQLDYIDDIVVTEKGLFVVGETISEDFPGMPLNYTITGTRGFLSRLEENLSGIYDLKTPPPLITQLTNETAKVLSEEAVKNHIGMTLNGYLKDQFFKDTKPYAKASLLRKSLERRFEQLDFLYGIIFTAVLEFHHCDYYMKASDNWDRSDLFYTIRGGKLGFVGHAVFSFLITPEKRQIIGVDYRTYGTETSPSNIQKRLYGLPSLSY